MRPDDHAARAEALLDQATSDDHHADRLIARAHVHALLALRSGPSTGPETDRRGPGEKPPPGGYGTFDRAVPDGYADSGIVHYGDGDATHDRM